VSGVWTEQRVRDVYQQALRHLRPHEVDLIQADLLTIEYWWRGRGSLDDGAVAAVEAIAASLVAALERRQA